MAFCVCAGAVCACSFGTAAAALTVTPENRVFAGGAPVATIMDNIPMKNIMPFGLCSSMANPQVAAATAAAMGTMTPMPCLPVIPSPWTPGTPAILLANKPILNQNGKASCAWGGVISITNPGNKDVTTP